MAGTIQRQTQARPSDAQHYVEYEEYVDYQLEKTRSIVKRTDILTTLTTLAVAVVAYLLAFVVFDQWIIAGGFGYAARVMLLSLVLGVVGATLVWRVLLPLMRQVHPLYAARVIESSDPQLQSNLVNFVDVTLSKAESAPAVLKSMQKRAAVELSHIDVEEAVDHRPLLRVAYALLAVVIVAAAYIVWSPKDTFTSVKRALLPTAPIEVATETTIDNVKPDENSDVPARTVVTIEADVHGKDADRAQILYTTHDHKYVDQVVEMRRIDPNLPRVRGVLNGENGRGLLQSLTYKIVAGDAHTRDYVINVIQPPGARLDEVHYVFPSYMQLEDKTTSGGDIDGWEGAVVTVKATANVPVRNAYVVLTDTEAVGEKGEERLMQVTDGTRLSATWKLEFRPDGTAYKYYHIQVETEKKEHDPDPTLYSYRIRPDQRPEVALLSPSGDLTMPANGIIPLVIQASDPDFQLRSVTLKVEKGGESFPDQRLFEDQNLGQSLRGQHDFRLAPLQLSAGDSILFWIEVKDNKAPTANRANTPRIKVDIGKSVSPAEAQKQLAEEKQKQQDQLKDAADANNSDGQGNEPPRDRANEPRPEDLPPPKDRQEPLDEKQAAKQRQKERVQESPADNKSDDSGNPLDQKPQSARTEDEVLQRLLQKQQQEQQEQQAGDNQDEQQQRPGNDKADGKSNDSSTDKSDASKSDAAKPDTSKSDATKANGEKSDRGQGSKPGQKSDGSGTKKDQNADKDQSEAGHEGADDAAEKAGANDQKANRDNSKKQPGANNSPADKKQQPDQPQPGSDKDASDNKQTPSADAKNQSGDKGSSNDKKDGGKKDGGKKTAGDQPGNTPNPTDSKPQSKPGSDDAKGNSGNDNPDKSADPNKAGNDKPGKPGEDGAGEDDGKQDGNSSQKKPGKDGSEKDGPDKKGPDKKGPDKKGPDKKGPDKEGTGKDESAKKDSEPGDSEKDDSSQQDDGKQDGKKDMKQDSPQDKAGSNDKPATDQKQQAKGGAGKKDAAESDPASNSKDKSDAKGSPGKSDKPEGDKQAGDSQGDKSNKKGEGPPKSSDDANPSGEEEPTADDASAKKKKATGDETGEASGNDEADPDATKANNDLKKKSGSQPGATKPSDESDGGAKKSDQKRQPQQGMKKGSPDADKSKRAPDGKGPTEKTDELDEPSSLPGDKKQDTDPENRPGQPPDVGTKPPAGDGRKGGQKSEQPQDGEKGGSAATDQGKPGANKPGAGDKGTDGNTDPTTEKTGQPGDKTKGPGSTTKPSEDGEGQKKDGPGDEAGDKGSKKGSDKGGQGKKTGDQGQPGKGGDKPGDKKGADGGKQPGQKSGKGESGSGSGSKPGDSKGQSDAQSDKPGQPGAGQQQSGSGISSQPPDGKPGDGPGDGKDVDPAKPREASTEEPSTAEEEQANLDAARKATNLVLQRLKSQLERGEVDQEMMDELGWKDKKDVEKFVKYLEKGMAQKNDDNSPEAEARRMQFEETLKSMDLGSQTQRRSGSVGKERAIEQIGAKNAPVPREYQKVWESYTRSLSKQQQDKGDSKSKAPEKAKAVKTK